MQRRRFLHLSVGGVASPAIIRIARAQAYPTGPVRVIVGFAAGGPTDVIARLISRWLSGRFGQQFVVENRPGAATNTATEAVIHAPADGHTLLLTNAANAINATLYDNLSYNFIRDIDPVAGISLNPLVMEVNRSLPVATVPEFIAYAKANPGKINFGSSGIGAAAHLTTELLKQTAGIDMVHVPYKGTAPALTALMANDIQILIDVPSTLMPHVQQAREVAFFLTLDAALRAQEAGLRDTMLPEVLLRRRLHADNMGIRERGSRRAYAHILKHALDRRRSPGGAGAVKPNAPLV
jgi:tripartite-type tricarboxylate transporter receptor subunit TctC